MEIVAVIWRGNNQKEMSEFMGKEYAPQRGVKDMKLAIFTLEGVMLANPGDYIIKGTHGEFYPVKPEIFEGKYEPVN